MQIILQYNGLVDWLYRSLQATVSYAINPVKGLLIFDPFLHEGTQMYDPLIPYRPGKKKRKFCIYHLLRRKLTVAIKPVIANARITPGRLAGAFVVGFAMGERAAFIWSACPALIWSVLV